MVNVFVCPLKKKKAKQKKRYISEIQFSYGLVSALLDDSQPGINRRWTKSPSMELKRRNVFYCDYWLVALSVHISIRHCFFLHSFRFIEQFNTIKEIEMAAITNSILTSKRGDVERTGSAFFLGACLPGNHLSCFIGLSTLCMCMYLAHIRVAWVLNELATVYISIQCACGR